MIYGEMLETLRDRLGISKIYIANMLEISDSLYSRYVKEKQIIPIKHLVTVANYFDVSIDYIFKFTEIKKYDNEKEDINPILSGIRLKEFRKENNLTQERLAVILNTDRTTISKYEKGVHLIATPFLYDLCKKYHVSADYLLGKIDKTQE